MLQSLLAPVRAFLGCETPDAWITEAIKPERLPLLLIDHCNCELKAAQTALFLVRKYAVDAASGALLLTWAAPYEAFVYHSDRDIDAFMARDSRKSELTTALMPRDNFPHGAELIAKMVRLIKEEFHHFEQVLALMHARNIDYRNIQAGRYAKHLMREVKTHEPQTLIDKLIVGALIEARSCERFAKLAPFLDAELGRFYLSLLRSEARHYQDYLTLAEQIAGHAIDARVAQLVAAEASLIQDGDTEFRFHSGVPVSA